MYRKKAFLGNCASHDDVLKRSVHYGKLGSEPGSIAEALGQLLHPPRPSSSSPTYG